MRRPALPFWLLAPARYFFLMSRLLNVAKYVLLLALSGALMWYALRNLDFARMADEVRAAKPQWIVLSLLVTLPGFFSRAWRWKMQLEAARRPVGFWEAYHAMMVGYLANLVLPRAGEVVRCTVLARATGVPVKVSLGTVITERIIDVVMLFSLLGLLLLVEFGRLKDFFWGLLHDRYDSLAANRMLLLTGAATLALGSVLMLTLLWRAYQRNRHHPKVQRAREFAKGLVDGVLSVARIRNQTSFWGHTLFTWSTYFFTALALFPTLPSTAGLDWHAGLALLVIGGFGMAAPVQGGIGVFHILVQGALMAYGLGKEQGMAYALISHTTQTVFVVVLGGISFVASMLQTARRKRSLSLSPVELFDNLETDEPDADEPAAAPPVRA